MQGILANLDVCDNIHVSMLEQHSNRLGVLNRRSELETADKGIRDFRIRTPSPHKKIVELSGGNQQKCIVARWLGTNPRCCSRRAHQGHRRGGQGGVLPHDL